jgi:hypothetical protein
MNLSNIIRTSINYDEFELLSFNRDVGKTERLEESMKKHGWIDAYPMHVVANGNGKLKIKDGHNRFYVARKLKIPAKYVVCEDNADVHELVKTIRLWDLKDYLASNIRVGKNPDYLKIKEFRDRTGIGILCCISMFSGESVGSNYYIESFKSGNFKIKNQSVAEKVGDIIVHCKKCGLAWAPITSFVRALYDVVRWTELNPAIFKKRVKSHIEKMGKRASKKEYLEMIEEVYSFGKKPKYPIAHLVAMHDQKDKDVE